MMLDIMFHCYVAHTMYCWIVLKVGIEMWLLGVKRESKHLCSVLHLKSFVLGNLCIIGSILLLLPPPPPVAPNGLDCCCSIR